MCGKLKKFSFLILLFFSFLGLFIPLKPALAVWAWLTSTLIAIPAIGFAFFFTITSVITALLARFSGMVLNWVIGPSFTELSYTNPARNDIIKVGLGITQGFVNMLLVLVLVYIAIATILRLAGYETKKLLVWFIIIALLVNFAPVICGLIVDASNIIMNFFLSEITGGKNLINQFGKIEEKLREGFNWKTIKEPNQITETAVQLGTITVLNLVLFFILLLFAFVFAARYIVIWILVILSPLAFVCYILPITRKIWSLWWQQFFAWSFIGVTCGFFLYLADLTTAIELKSTPPTGELGSAILPYLIPIGFLIIGLVFGLKTSAMGASTVMSLGKRGQKWVGGRIWRKGIKPRVEPAFKKATGALIQGINLSKVPILKRIPGVKDWKPGLEKIPVGRWFIPEAARRYAEFRPTIDYEKAQLKDFNSRAIGHRIALGELKGTMATGGIMELLDRGDMQDLISAYKTKYYGKDADKKSDAELFAREDFQKEMKEPVELSFRAGYQSKLLRGDPRLARIAAGKEWAFGYYKDDEGKLIEPDKAVQKAAKEARAKNIENWEREVLMDKDVAETLLSRGRDAPESIDRLVKRGQETLLKTFDKNFSEWIDKELIKKAPDIVNSVKKGDQPATELALKRYQAYIKSKYGTDSYFKYAEGPRAIEIGWREPEYVAENKRKEQPPVAKAGLQAGLGKRPSEIPQEPPDTGEVGARKRKKVESRVIDTGEAGERKKPKDTGE